MRYFFISRHIISCERTSIPTDKEVVCNTGTMRLLLHLMRKWTKYDAQVD